MSEAIKRTGASLKRGKSETVVGTPQVFVEAVETKFGELTIDLAASPENHKRSRYFSKEDDSLAQDWENAIGKGIGWLNPPYNNITPWAIKGDEEGKRGAKILMLVPASVGSNWFRDYVHDMHRVIFLNGRIQFVGQKWGFPKDLMLVGFGMKPGYVIWTPPKEALK